MVFYIPEIFSPGDAQSNLRQAARSRRIGLGLTQTALSDRSGVPLSSLKRFEQTGEISVSALLRIAMALDALREFAALFPAVESGSLDEIERSAKPRQRASRKRR